MQPNIMDCNRSDISYQNQIILDQYDLVLINVGCVDLRGEEQEREREREKGGRKTAKVANHSYLCLIHSEFIC